MASDRQTGKRIYTIGHSNHTPEEMIALLRRHGVTTVVDVRSAPYSKWASQFNKGELGFALSGAGIGYRYSGKELGGMPESEDLHTAGKPDYDKIAAQPEFDRELRDVVNSAGEADTCLLCSEGDPMLCHRERLLARVLRSWGVDVAHILPDGELQRQEQGSLF
ncbi:MAG: DUF488 domain-containing protein [Armatimonadota bacterium]|nr:DUF488 domain-containing protein [Armatimonadota bacterium]